jgi:hypothetical protein
MIVGTNYTYIHLPKCGGTSITKILEKYYSGNKGVIHSKLTTKPNDKKIIGSIRNPLDWYVSLWAYGCSDKGYFNGLLRMTHPDTDKLYNDFNNIDNFKKWLNIVFNLKSPQFHQCEIYPNKMAEHNVGPMTSRFITFYQLNDWSVLGDINKDNLVDYYIRQENMNKDIKEIMLSITNKNSVFENIQLNSSQHKHFSEYYDEETLKLVSTKDKYIYNKFKYEKNINK